MVFSDQKLWQDETCITLYTRIGPGFKRVTLGRPMGVSDDCAAGHRFQRRSSLYSDIATELTRIVSGAYQLGSLQPSVVDLMSELGASAIPIRRSRP